MLMETRVGRTSSGQHLDPSQPTNQSLGYCEFFAPSLADFRVLLYEDRKYFHSVYLLKFANIQGLTILALRPLRIRYVMYKVSQKTILRNHSRNSGPICNGFYEKVQQGWRGGQQTFGPTFGVSVVVATTSS